MPYIGYTVILLICIGIGLVAFGRIKEKWYPFILYGSGAGMVLMTTLAGPYLIGSDIHLEYYYAQFRAGGDVWAPVIGVPQGTSIIHYISSSIWFYKIVYPLLFSLVPPMLYCLYQKWLTKKQAFLAAFLFIAFPPFFMELPTIARQAIAELVLVGALLLLVRSTLRLRYKIPVLVVLGGLLPLVHYSIAIISIIVLVISLILNWVLKAGRGKILGATLAGITFASLIYFPIAEDGAVDKKIMLLYNGLAPSAFKIDRPILETPKPEKAPPQESVPVSPPEDRPLEEKYSLLMRLALGFDFEDTSILGKVFRILQWTILGLIIWGLWKLRRHKEYWVIAGGFILISLLCLHPAWARIMNATRFTHLSMLLLAPAFAVALKPKYLSVLLVPYFLFTSGLVFEATKVPNIQEVGIPYSIGLSDYRIDMGATFTEDDVEVRDYIIDNKLFPLMSDLYGADFIGEKIGLRGDLNWSLSKTGRALDCSYVYIRSRNVEEDYFTVWWGIGLRRYISPEEFDIDWDKNIVFQSGDARVIKYV